MGLFDRASATANDFFGVLRQVRVDEILGEAERPFHIAVVGSPGSGKSTLAGRLAAGTYGSVLEPFGLRRLIEYSLPLSPQMLQSVCDCDLVIWLQDVTAPRVDDTFTFLRAQAPAFLHVANKADLLVGDWPQVRRDVVLLSAHSTEDVTTHLVPAILDALPEHGLALGRNFSIFRPTVAEREVQRVARVNAEVAVLSAIPQATLLLGPASAVADTLVLTKNQAVLLLRLAAMCGLEVNRARLLELLPVIGAAFGWRSLARELVGFLPAGVGVVPKAAIAYAGTVAIGKAAAWYYQTGRRLPEAQVRQIYAESSARAKDLVREITTRLRRAG
ncbi:MAG: hypothetical protein KGJ86_05455 [Chloroflexota bacterium]|nr:hypothetical protein [Chloroflexota bacterium]